MIVEILGAKMLAPFLGTSHFVWTAQIAITMLALALGYYAGGRLVDRSPRLGRMYAGILIAAIYLCLTVLVVGPIADWSLRFGLRAGTLLTSTFLFFVPLSLLAMVGPFFVRVMTVTIGTVGGNVGRLTAIGTLGSFIGTILIGYVLIPFLPNSITMYLTAALLMGLAAIYFFGWARPRTAAVTAGILAGLALGYWGVHRDLHPQFEEFEELARLNSEFGLLQVLQDKDSPRRLYLNDYLTQNTYDIQEKQSTSMFTYMLHHLARAYAPEIKDVLCIGLGVGIVPMQFLREGAHVDVVEINPAVVPIAANYFNCETGRFDLIVNDGRYYVNQATQRYDALILDAFLGDSSPSHLLTREAFRAMRRVLRPDGVLVINCFGDFEAGRDFFVASLEKTLKAAFRTVRIHNDYNGGNVFFVASDQADLKIRWEPDFAEVHPLAERGVRTAFRRVVETNPDSGIVLTDDYNPVEFHDAVNRERFRKQLAQGVRGL